MADSHNHHQDHNQRPHYEPLPEPKLPFLLKLFDAPATFIRGLLVLIKFTQNKSYFIF